MAHSWHSHTVPLENPMETVKLSDHEPTFTQQMAKWIEVMSLHTWECSFR